VAPLSVARGSSWGSKGVQLSDMAFKALFDRVGVTGVMAHGFRSAFRDWAGETTSFPRKLAEAALAHSVGNEVERAYRRGDALEKRRKMMLAWERFLGSRSDNVVGLETLRTPRVGA
jgi:integrase